MALIADLVVFVAVVAVVAVLPIVPGPDGTTATNPLRLTELLVLLLAPFVVVGLFGRLLEKPHVPGNEWAYLATLGYAVFAFGLLGFFTEVSTAPTLIIALALVMIPSVVGSFFAHILDGGNKRLAPRVAAWVDRDAR
jgi:hypothetical protein